MAKERKVQADVNKTEFRAMLTYMVDGTVADGFSDGNQTVNMLLRPDEMKFLEEHRRKEKK